MSGEELRERLAEALSVVEGEMTTYSPDAHPDHNRWSWRGDGHGDVIRGRYYALADEALAIVLPERDAARPPTGTPWRQPGRAYTTTLRRSRRATVVTSTMPRWTAPSDGRLCAPTRGGQLVHRLHVGVPRAEVRLRR